MGRGISGETQIELLRLLRDRYKGSSKSDKTKILDEFVAVSGFHRKHAIRLLTGPPPTEQSSHLSRRVYDEAVQQVLIVAWEASDRICSKRLKSVLPSIVEAMERHGHLDVEQIVRDKVLAVSAATIDRLLKPVRIKAKRRRSKCKKKVSKQVPIKTFSDWNEPAPGYLEIDFVAHCGGSLSGSFIHSLVATDVCSGWTEAIPLLAREQSLVVAGIQAIGQQFPINILGVNSDNDSAFINDTLLDFCNQADITFTRSRPYRKNDQAWIEQKNGSVIRRFAGYERFSGPVAGQALAKLHALVRLYVNYFQPSFKLIEKSREGATVTKRYDLPATPCDRLLTHPSVHLDIREEIQIRRASLDPIDLLYRIRKTQAALAALVSGETDIGHQQDEIKDFLAQLPRLWQQGEIRPTHTCQSTKSRHWRTRKDPFEKVWIEILPWLQNEPEATAKQLFQRLQILHPGVFNGQLRTLQRRVKDWRAVMAKQLVFGALRDDNGSAEITPIGMMSQEQMDTDH